MEIPNNRQGDTGTPSDEERRSEPPVEDGSIRRSRVVGGAGLLLALSLSALIVTQRGALSSLGAYGYPGLFLVSMLSSATVLLPAPGLAFVFAMGNAVNPMLGGIVAGLGAAVGELTGYLAGASGRAMIEDRVRYDRLVSLMRKRGLLVVFILSAIPNPLFDLAGVASGALRFPPGRFLIACWGGQVLKYTAIALLGAGMG